MIKIRSAVLLMSLFTIYSNAARVTMDDREDGEEAILFTWMTERVSTMRVNEIAPEFL